jgi:hypothetical protein
MNFYIRRNSILPNLKMKLIFDGRNDYKRFYDLLENSVVTFSMKNVNNGVYKVANKDGEIIKVDNNGNDEWYVQYNWEVNDTNELGQFEGEFKIKFLDDCTHIIVPIKENLYINVLTSFTKGDIEENNNLIDGDGCLIYCDVAEPFTGGTVSGSTEFLSGITVLGNIFSGNTELNDIFLNIDENIVSGVLNGDDLILSRENGEIITISGFTSNIDIYTTGITLSGNTLIFNRNDNNDYEIDLTPIIGGTNTFITGGTFNNNILTLERNDNINIDISGFTDYYTTGVTWNGVNTATFERNDGNNYNLTIDDLHIDNFSANTITSGSTNLIDVINNISSQYSANTFTTGSVLSGTTVIFTRNDNQTYNLDLSTLSGTTVTDFSLDCNTNELNLQQSNGDNYNVDLSCLLSGMSTTDIFTTGSTLSGGTAIFNRNDGNNYTLDLSSLTGSTSTITGTTGSVAFFGTSNTITQDNTNFFWNNINKRLGIRESSPDSSLVIRGADTGNSTFALKVHNLIGNNNALVVRDDGRVGIGTSSPLAQLHIDGAFPDKIGLLINGTNITANNVSSAVWQNNGVTRGSIYVADSGSDALRGIKISNPTADSDIMVAAGNRGITISNQGSFTNTLAYSTAVTNLLGASTPLTVFGRDGSTGGSFINHIQNTQTAGRQTYFLHRFLTSTNVIVNYGGFGTELMVNTNAAHSGDLFWSTALTGTFAERMRLKASGSLLIGTTTETTSSILTLSSVTKGVLLPRMDNTAINAISTPATGLLVYSTTENTFAFYNGTSWRKINDSLL